MARDIGMSFMEIKAAMKALEEEAMEKKLSALKKSSKRSKGLGDTIKKITNAVGVRQCGGCKKRQNKLNKLFPYGKKDKT